MAVATAAWAQKMNLCSVFPSPLPCTICHGSLSYCHLTRVLILHSGDVLVVILLSLTNLSQTFPPMCLQGCSVHWSEWSLTDTGSRFSPWCWAANSGLDHARMVTAAAGSRTVREEMQLPHPGYSLQQMLVSVSYQSWAWRCVCWELCCILSMMHIPPLPSLWTTGLKGSTLGRIRVCGVSGAISCNLVIQSNTIWNFC